MSVENLIAGVGQLSQGINTYKKNKREEEKTARDLLEAQRVREANKKIGTELLEDNLNASTPEVKFAARGLQEGTIDAEKAMAAFSKMTPESQLGFLTTKAFSSKDPALQELSAYVFNAYARTQEEKARAEAKGKMAGSIEGGALLLKSAGSGGGGGGGSGSSGGSESYQGHQVGISGASLYGSLNFNDPHLQEALVDIKGRKLKIDPEKPLLSQISPYMNKKDYDKVRGIIREQFKAGADSDAIISRTGNPAYSNFVADDATEKLFKVGREAFQQPIFNPKNPAKVIGYTGNKELLFTMDSQDIVKAATNSQPAMTQEEIETLKAMGIKVPEKKRFKKINIKGKDLSLEK